MERTVSQSKQVVLALLLLLIGMMVAACSDSAQRHATPTPTAPAGHLSLTPAPSPASVAYVTGFSTLSTQSTYFVAALNTSDGSVRWRYIPADFISGMIAVGDVVLFEQRNDATGSSPQTYQLVALNASDGSVRWTHSAAALGQFTAQGNAVYILEANTTPPATSGFITSLDIHSGAVRWRKTVAAGVGQPMVVGSLLYDYIAFAPTTTTGTTSELITLDSNTGKQRWLYKEGSLLQMPMGETRPLVIGNCLYMLSTFNLKAGHPLDDVVALDADSGSLRWRSIIGGQVIGLATDGNAIYLSAELTSPSGVLQSPGYEVEALRENDGQTLWNTPLTYVPSAPVVANNEVFITAAGALTMTSPVNRALALSAADGRAIWRIPGTATFLAGQNPATDGDSVYLVKYLLSAQVAAATPFPANTEVSLIKAVSAADGQPRWETPLSAGIYPNTPIVANGKLFITFFFGSRPDLAVLDAASGSILWRFGAPDSAITSLALPA